MGKFNTSTAAGTASALDTASVNLPVAPTPEVDAAEAASATGGSILDQVIAEGVSQEVAETFTPDETLTETQEQQARDRVPSIKERQQANETGVYDYNQEQAMKEHEQRVKVQQRLMEANVANSTVQSDGGFNKRAMNMEEAVKTPDLPGLGSLGVHATGPVKEAYMKSGLVDEGGVWTPQAGLVLSVVTENFFSDRAYGKDVDAEIDYEELGVKASEVERTDPFSKARGRAQLGRQIAAEKARLDGRESPQLTEEEATALGDTAQELYYEVNKQNDGDQFIIRTEVGEGLNKQTAFQLTQKGSDLLMLGDQKRKRLFPKQHVRTQKAPLGAPTKEAREYTRQVSSKTGVSQVRSHEQRQALRNLNKVANVVDPKRNKILLSVALQALRGQSQFENDVLFISDDDPQGTMNNLAQDIFGIQIEKDGANYLTYYVQDFNGRMAPQQTTLDPTASKAARFVTRNAIPADTSNSRIKRNLLQMYSMHLVPDSYSGLRKGDVEGGKPVPVDQLLPAERARIMQNPALQAQLSGWGAELKAAFDKIPDNTINQISEAIKEKRPVNELPQLPPLELSPDLMEFINGKGEDGFMVMDGLIDYHNFLEAEKKGKPYHSYFNATMDGKTNGIASNGIQMGSANVAKKTGVIKTQNKQILDRGMDIRDDLEHVLKGLIDQGFDGKFNDNELPIVRKVAAKIAGDRNFNKAITMTFGYGKEIQSFKRDIQQAIADDPDAAGLDQKEVTDAIFQNYIPAMEQVMDEDALAARSLMRSATWVAAWYNELFQMRAPLEGQVISLGKTETTGLQGEIARGQVWTGSEYRRPTISQYGSEATSAAEKAYPAKEEGGAPERVAGDVAYGGSIPGPVQSLDAATVTRTVSGKSWDRLVKASQGHPYIHTVYDAFKTDANGFDVVLEETNKNWLDLNMQWSYLESMAEAAKEARARGKAKFADRSDGDLLTDNEALMLRQWIQTNDKGELADLRDRFKNLLIDPDSAKGAAENVKQALIKAGYSKAKPPTVGQLKAAIAAIEKELNVDSRMAGFIEKTNAKKKRLAEQIRAEAPKGKETLGYDLRSGAQYYAH